MIDEVSSPLQGQHLRHHSVPGPQLKTKGPTNLIFRMTLKQQDIHHIKLIDKSVPLKFLPHLRPYC